MMDVCYLKGRGWLKSKKLMKRKFNKGKWIRFGAEDLYKYLCLLNFPGNYVIFYYKKPIYIGQSLNIKNRLNRYFLNELKKEQIKKEDFSGTQIAVRKEKIRFERLTLEARLICRLSPILNKEFSYNKQETPEKNIIKYIGKPRGKR